MLELTMAPSLGNLIPALVIDEADDVSNLQLGHGIDAGPV
jgi:hypothetical protein